MKSDVMYVMMCVFFVLVSLAQWGMYETLSDQIDDSEVSLVNGTAQDDDVPVISIEDWEANSSKYANDTFREIIIIGNVSYIGKSYARVDDYIIYKSDNIELVQNTKAYILCRITKIDGILSLRLIDYWLV